MEPVLRKKLEELKANGEIVSFSIDYFLRLLGNAEYLTSIKKKAINNITLSKFELVMLYGAYEVKTKNIYSNYTKVYGYEYTTFGSEVDPKISEIIDSRNQQEDFEKFSEEEKRILLSREDYTYNVKINDEKVILDIDGLRYASDDLVKNTKFIRKYMDKSAYNASILKYTAPNINSNKKLVMDVLKTKSNDDYKYIDDKLMKDKEIIFMMIQKDANSIRYISNDVLDKYPEFKMLAEYKSSFEILSLINEYFYLVDNNMISDDRKEYISKRLLTLIEHAPLRIRNDFYTMLRASMINSEVLNYTNSDIKTQVKCRR